MRKSISLENLNMKYVSSESNEELQTGAILVCCSNWDYDQLSKWLPSYDLDMIESIQDWLNNPSYIAEGLYLKVWCD